MKSLRCLAAFVGFATFILLVAGARCAAAAPPVNSAAAGTTDFPVWIELDKPQLVTVVIEDAAGQRVRNLVAEMQLPAGRNRLSWDGFDDGQRNAGGDLIRKRVTPGSRLYIGDHKVVQGNRNETITYDGDILLKAGQHAIRVEYVNDFARAQLQVSWQGPGFGKTEITKDSLWREP